MSPTLFIEQLTFSGGASVTLEPDSIVVIVGPNNAGKSATLRDILRLAPSRRHGGAATQVVTDLMVGRSGTVDDFLARMAPYRLPNSQNYSLKALEDSTPPLSPHETKFRELNVEQVRENELRTFWEQKEASSVLTEFFFFLLEPSTRFRAIEPAKVFNLATDIPFYPIQKMCVDSALANRLSRYFQSAFGQSLIVNQTAGSRMPLHCGEIPILEPGEDRISLSYARKLEKLPQLQNQGDGMRSFADCLLHVAAVDKTVVMIDEPEAFLHPPQARFLGALLAREKPAGRQLIIATHSGDLLRGLLDANPSSLKIIRLTREGDLNHARALDTDKIRTLWDDSILRFSNTLDGLFHEQVVLCEADGDCRFYAALLNASQPVDTGERRPDVMFTSTGGKHKIPKIAAALVSIGVPTRAVVDFDVLNSDSPLQGVIEALGGKWSDFHGSWKQVKSGIEQLRPELETAYVKKEIEKLLQEVSGTTFPNETAKQIQEVIKRASPWDSAKRNGLGAVPTGQALQMAESLLADLKQLGLFVVDCGEMESFYRTIGGHGNAWLEKVLLKDLHQDPRLENARKFVRGLFSLNPP
ncbi:AAA family ATPase [Myxococcus sp. AM011]|uniref:ATP-dependent nuclease n=1 Tax=Myxococcus sp. AM011 TaxID=2745200 RepID=UPI001596108C|nr:AAA family ATPase [Myxococcus sp. AM011]NVJ19636.1 AAA family ATPase [Myxococcus sp. AM011]